MQIPGNKICTDKMIKVLFNVNRPTNLTTKRIGIILYRLNENYSEGGKRKKKR